jgi:hypothetical protein
MSALHLDLRNRVTGDAGWVTLKIDIANIAQASDRDLKFAEDVIVLMSRFVQPPPAVPSVLRGVVAGGGSGTSGGFGSGGAAGSGGRGS